MAEKKWTDAKKKATDDAQAVADAVQDTTLKALRQDVLAEANAWKLANNALVNLIQTAADNKGKMDLAEATMKKTVLDCQVGQYDKYRETLEAAITQRKDDLKAIKNLLDAQEVKAVGTAGARCEKAMSNGTMRPRKALGRETVCDEGLCCGASRVWMPSGTTEDAAW